MKTYSRTIAKEVENGWIVTLLVRKDVLEQIEVLLSKGGYVEDAGPDEVMNTFTAIFPNYIEADIKFCNGDGPYIDAVLFKEGNEVNVLEPSDSLEGEYPFQHEGKEYMVVVKAE